MRQEWILTGTTQKKKKRVDSGSERGKRKIDKQLSVRK